MDPAWPEATAVAVRDGSILAVGSLSDLQPWLQDQRYEIVRDFERKVLLPGLIDPHLHPFMAAAMIMTDIVTAFEWQLPWATVTPVRGKDAYVAELRRIEQGKSDPSEPLMSWGYHPFWHGAVARADLDAVSASRPIVVWHRSAHEMFFNTAALQRWNLTEEEARSHSSVDYPAGNYWESGMVELAAPKLAPYIFDRTRFLAGVARARDVVRFGGITTIAEMSFGITDPDLEWLGPQAVLDRDDVPFRTFFVADAKTPTMKLGVEQALAWADALPQRNTHRLRFGRHIKLFADGAFYSLGMQIGGAGYIDGHHGEWMTPVSLFEQLARTFWNSGYQIHVHTNGDAGLEMVLGTLQMLQDVKPRVDHRFTIEHFAYGTGEQVRKLARLGAIVSANPYYMYEMGDEYLQRNLGRDRTSKMVRIGSVVRAGVPLALHSDFAMAPAQPLRLAQIAITRRTADGAQLAESERLTLDQALRAITVDAAFMLGLENEIGSVTSGKRADFTILDEDPYAVDAGSLADIPIWGTIFEGKPFARQ
jgi:predicted amidohydrolase YtcJ